MISLALWIIGYLFTSGILHGLGSEKLTWIEHLLVFAFWPVALGLLLGDFIKDKQNKTKEEK